jgi:hypothetical protein
MSEVFNIFIPNNISASGILGVISVHTGKILKNWNDVTLSETVAN